MKLPNELYDVIKWITLVVLPALAAAYVGLAAIWGFPYAEAISKTAVVVCTLLGALLGISTAEYNAEKAEKAEQERFTWHDKELDE